MCAFSLAAGLLRDIAIASIGVSATINAIFVMWFMSSEFRQSRDLLVWYDKHKGPALAVFFLALFNSDIVRVLTSGILSLSAFSAPLSARGRGMLTYCGLLSNIFEDIPQMVVQVIYLSSNNDSGTVSSTSIVAAKISLALTVVHLAFAFIKRGLAVVVVRANEQLTVLERQKDSMDKEMAGKPDEGEDGKQDDGIDMSGEQDEEL